MAAATGNQVSGGSPRPRPRPPEISTCGGLSRPGRRRRAARHQIPVVLYMAIHHRASCLDCHCLAPSPVRAAYCLRASLSTRATPRTRVARSATATYHRLVSVPLALYGNVATASRRRSIARPTVCTRHSRPMRRREHGSRGPGPPVAINFCRSRGPALGWERRTNASNRVAPDATSNQRQSIEDYGADVSTAGRRMLRSSSGHETRRLSPHGS